MAISRVFWLAGFLVVVLFTLTWVVAPIYLPTAESRIAFGTMFGAVNALFTGLAFLGVIAAIVSDQQRQRVNERDLALELQRSRRLAAVEAWGRWFSADDTGRWRAYVFNLFVPESPYWRKCMADETVSMRNLQQHLPEEWGITRANLSGGLTRLGWLGAERLIEIDHILGPMQHLVKRTWWVMEPLIERARVADPVYATGFQWLYEECLSTTQGSGSRGSSRLISPAHIADVESFDRRTATLEEGFKNFLAGVRAASEGPLSGNWFPQTDWDPLITCDESVVVVVVERDPMVLSDDGFC